MKQADAMMREHLGSGEGVPEEVGVAKEDSLNEELDGDMSSMGGRSELTASPQ